jgi:hypothetical protein
MMEIKSLMKNSFMTELKIKLKYQKEMTFFVSMLKYAKLDFLLLRTLKKDCFEKKKNKINSFFLFFLFYIFSKIYSIYYYKEYVIVLIFIKVTFIFFF